MKTHLQTITSICVNMEALQKQAESENGLLQDIAKKLGELTSDIESLKSDIEALTSNIETRAYNISSIQKEIKKITTTIDELKSEMNHEETMKRINAQKQLTNK